MRIKLIALLLFALPMVAFAQESPVGRWKTYDEDTGKPRLIVDVYEAKGNTIAAKVVDTLFAPNATCTECSGAAKNKPIKDMVILWGLQKDGDAYGKGSRAQARQRQDLQVEGETDRGRQEVRGVRLRGLHVQESGLDARTLSDHPA